MPNMKEVDLSSAKFRLSSVATDVRQLFDADKVGFVNRMRCLAKQNGWLHVNKSHYAVVTVSVIGIDEHDKAAPAPVYECECISNDGRIAVVTVMALPDSAWEYRS